MSTFKSKLDASGAPPEPESPKPLPSESLPSEPPPHMDIEQWIENLKRADRSFYNLMALEVWSIAKTMDGLIPGFWNRFMTNRKIALQQFMQQKKAHAPADDSGTQSTND